MYYLVAYLDLLEVAFRFDRQFYHDFRPLPQDVDKIILADSHHLHGGRNRGSLAVEHTLDRQTTANDDVLTGVQPPTCSMKNCQESAIKLKTAGQIARSTAV